MRSIVSFLADALGGDILRACAVPLAGLAISLFVGCALPSRRLLRLGLWVAAGFALELLVLGIGVCIWFAALVKPGFDPTNYYDPTMALSVVALLGVVGVGTGRFVRGELRERQGRNSDASSHAGPYRTGTERQDPLRGLRRWSWKPERLFGVVLAPLLLAPAFVCTLFDSCVTPFGSGCTNLALAHAIAEDEEPWTCEAQAQDRRARGHKVDSRYDSFCLHLQSSNLQSRGKAAVPAILEVLHQTNRRRTWDHERIERFRALLDILSQNHAAESFEELRSWATDSTIPVVLQTDALRAATVCGTVEPAVAWALVDRNPAIGCEAVAHNIVKVAPEHICKAGPNVPAIGSSEWKAFIEREYRAHQLAGR